MRGQFREIQGILIHGHPACDETGDIRSDPGDENGACALFSGMNQIIDMLRRDPLAQLPRQIGERCR